MVINKDIFNLTEIQEQDMRENLIEINKKRQEICFPSKKIKNDKTGEITYQNIPNKFDFSNQLSNTYQAPYRKDNLNVTHAIFLSTKKHELSFPL